MAISPRKDEVVAVVDILAAEHYDTAEKMAADIIRRVATMLAARSSFGVYVELVGAGPRAGFSMGPYWTKGEAEKALESAVSAGMRGFVAALHSTDTVRPPTNRTLPLCACAHRPEMHVSRYGCAVYKCPCSVYELAVAPTQLTLV